jgi:hypothetical protein
VRAVGRSSQPRIVALALILCALLLRAALPAGLMLAPNAAGHVDIVLCDGVAPAHHHGDAGRHRQDAQPCPFAIALNSATPPAPPAFAIPPTPVRAAAIVAPLAATPRLAVAAPTPPATGPPATL